MLGKKSFQYLVYLLWDLKTPKFPSEIIWPLASLNLSFFDCHSICFWHQNQYRKRKLNPTQKYFFQVQPQLKSESCQHQKLSYIPGLKFNNSRYNASLSNGKQAAFCIVFFSTFHYITVYLHKNMIISEYDILLYRKFLVEPINLKIGLPVLYTIYRQDVCQFMWRVICNYVPKKLLIDIHSNI